MYFNVEEVPGGMGGMATAHQVYLKSGAEYGTVLAEIDRHREGHGAL